MSKKLSNNKKITNISRCQLGPINQILNIHTYAHAYVYVHVHAHARAHTHARTHACTHARTHAHNHFTALLDLVWDYPGETVTKR